MTKKELIKALEPFSQDDVVILSDGDGWANIEDILQDGSSIKLTMADHPLSDRD